ncbi:MAG: GHKL domain-containing protein [Lachnospiraceae bacterium]|nr:GHKL domain-containing protein [Lachnospiraceae bacterium]
MELIIQFVIHLYDLAVFWYYQNTFQKKKSISKKLIISLSVVLAIVWSGINRIGSPFVNLLALLINLCILSMLFEGDKRSKVIHIIAYLGVGIVLNFLGLILLNSINFNLNSEKWYIYYFVAALVSFVRGNVFYFICKSYVSKELHFSKFPKEMMWGILLIFIFLVMNSCFIINLMMESTSRNSHIMCISLMISGIATYCFMLYMIERKRYETEKYRKEMYYKEIYYNELEKKNEYVQNLKHDLKNKLYGVVYCIETGDMAQLSEQVDVIYEELRKVDTSSYSLNSAVDSIIKIKMGVAKAAGIETNVSISIPNKIGLDYGDIGVLYGNLLDNAIEACVKLPKEDRYIRVENKMVEGNMLLIIQNTKIPEKNEQLLTTKEDKYNHGRGINSVRKVIEKYNGDISFFDRGEGFEVIATIYGVESVG